MNSFTVYDVNLVNAPIFHLYFKGGNGFTVWGVRIKTPATARNTDGIDPDSATNVTINDSYIQDGDDGIAIKASSAAACNMTIENSHFYGTHGISIGSETQNGVTNILIENNTVSGTDSSGNVSSDNNGLRIKTTPARAARSTRSPTKQLPDRGQARPGVRPVLLLRQRLDDRLREHRGQRPEGGQLGVQRPVGARRLQLSALLGLTLESVSLEATAPRPSTPASAPSTATWPRQART